MSSNDNLLPVYIIKIHPINPKAFQFCKRNNIIGFGWSLKSKDNPTTICEYDYMRKQEPDLRKKASLTRSIKAFTKLQEHGGYIWTRGSDKNYYLCKTNGEYSYNGNDRKYKRVDVINCIDSCFYQVGEALVPTQIIKQYKTRGTTKEVNEKTAIELTEEIYQFICHKQDKDKV